MIISNDSLDHLVIRNQMMTQLQELGPQYQFNDETDAANKYLEKYCQPGIIFYITKILSLDEMPSRMLPDHLAHARDITCAMLVHVKYAGIESDGDTLKPRRYSWTNQYLYWIDNDVAYDKIDEAVRYAESWTEGDIPPEEWR